MVALNPSHSPATVIGGNKVNAGANATKDVAGRPVYLFLQYLTSVMALVSCLLWMVQYVVIPTTGAAVSWEFVLFVAYLQRMASLSHSVTRRVPYFLWEYVDAFSWTVFMPFHNAAAGVARRRLDEVVVVLDGVVAFADRIGVKESTLLNRGVIGMLVMAGAVGLVIVVAWLAQLCSTRSSRHPMELEAWPSNEQTRRCWLDRLGCMVPLMFWLFTLYPMALLSSFEITMEIRAHDVSGASLTVALLVLVFGIGMLYIFQIVGMAKKARQETIDKSIEGFFHTHPWLFTTFVVVQVASGIIVSSVRSPTAQLVAQMALVVAFHAFAWQWIRSSRHPTSTGWIILALGLIQVANLGLSFEYVSSMDDATISEGSHRVAVAYIVLNSAVVLVIFARQFALACLELGLMMDNRQIPDSKDNQSESSTINSFIPMATPPHERLTSPRQYDLEN